MNKRITIGSLAIILMFTLTGCCINHEWKEATCTNPKTCKNCGELEGNALGHTWVKASCSTPKKCSICGETEGNTLEHTWIEATCTSPKKCSACGETEGETLAHTLTEANYQQAATCQVCGKEIGEPLQADYEKWGIDTYAAELDKVYDIDIECYDNTEKTTVAKIIFTNYQTFKSDENHPAKEGYEWKTLDIKAIVGDDNATNYGYKFSTARWFDDYYKWIDNNEDNRFSVNYNGIEYTDCEYYLDVDNSGWEKKEQFGWINTLTLVDTVSILVPEGYDGFIWGYYNNKSNFMDVETKDASPDDYIFFRFE